MKIDISNKDPYDAVADYIIQHSVPSSAYVVKIKTTSLGESMELLYDDGEDWLTPAWVWMNDWYEGGEVELLGYISIHDVVGDAQRTANWVELN